MSSRHWPPSHRLKLGVKEVVDAVAAALQDVSGLDVEVVDNDEGEAEMPPTEEEPEMPEDVSLEEPAEDEAGMTPEEETEMIKEVYRRVVKNIIKARNEKKTKRALQESRARIMARVEKMLVRDLSRNGRRR